MGCVFQSDRRIPVGDPPKTSAKASAVTHNHSVYTTAARFRSPATYLECGRKTVRLATHRLNKQDSQRKPHRAWRSASPRRWFLVANSADRGGGSPLPGIVVHFLVWQCGLCLN